MKSQPALEELEKIKSEIITDASMKNKDKELIVYILDSLKWMIAQRSLKYRIIQKTKK